MQDIPDRVYELVDWLDRHGDAPLPAHLRDRNLWLAAQGLGLVLLSASGDKPMAMPRGRQAVALWRLRRAEAPPDDEGDGLSFAPGQALWRGRDLGLTGLAVEVLAMLWERRGAVVVYGDFGAAFASEDRRGPLRKAKHEAKEALAKAGAPFRIIRKSGIGYGLVPANDPE